MQNAQNTEIQQRVINLVELYRTKVGKESQAAKELAEEYKRQYDIETDIAYSMGFHILDIDIPEDAVDAIRANEQLLGYFYKEVAGDDVDSDVLSSFLPERYDSSIFSEEETAFLKNHFAEMVNYIIMTPNNNLLAVKGNDMNDIDLLPQEVLCFVKERYSIPVGSMVYNPFTGFAQLACLYKECSFFCEESYISYSKRWNVFCDKLRETGQIEYKEDENRLYAWMRVVLYANKINATVIENSLTPQNYNAVVSYIPYIPSAIPNKAQGRMGDELSDPDMINKIISAYQNLDDGGKMILIIPTEYLGEKRAIHSEEGTKYRLELEALWKQMIDDKSLVEIVQLPSVMGKNVYDEGHCIVIANKGCEVKNVTFIDARFASFNSEGSFFNQTLDLDALHKMIENGGKEDNTGLRKFVQIPRIEIISDFLVPQVYVLEKPSKSEAPVPLTELCSLEMSHIYDIKEILPENTPWVKEGDLSTTFQGILDFSSLGKADCPNNPEGWKYGNRKLSNLLMGENKYPEKDIRISHYRNCKYVDGDKNAVLFKLSKEGINISVINATGNTIAVSPDIHILLPNYKINVLSLAAILQMPVVYRQIEAYQNFDLYSPHGHLKDILVPTDKRIIHDEIHRLKNEYETYKKQEELLATKKTEYINEVRMRKHDMGQYIFELMNIEDLMRYYLENRDTEKDFCQQIESLLDNFRSSLGELSTLLDNLSKEEQFGKPEMFNIDVFLSRLANRHKADGFVISYFRDDLSFYKYNRKMRIGDLYGPISDPSAEIDDLYDPVDDLSAEIDDSNVSEELQENAVGNSAIPALLVASSDMQRLVSNIVDNARKHGFTDPNRKDYEIKVSLSIDVDKNMYQIDFRNNGNPLPDGMDKMRYGLKGEKAGKTAGTGLGGNYVKSFVEHYGGDYDIFMEDGWTVVKICLPIK